MTRSPELAGRACEDAWVWGQEGSGGRYGHGRDGVGIRAPGPCAPRDAGCSLLLKQFASRGAGPERPRGLPRCGVLTGPGHVAVYGLWIFLDV